MGVMAGKLSLSVKNPGQGYIFVCNISFGVTLNISNNISSKFKAVGVTILIKCHVFDKIVIVPQGKPLHHMSCQNILTKIQLLRAETNNA